jgi:Fic family protein
MVRQIVAIERGTGFLNAVRLQADWIADVRQEARIRDAMDSVEIEGHSVTYERAFELARNPDATTDDKLRQSEREFLNYLRTFDAVEAFQNDRKAVLTKTDLRNLHGSIVSGVRGSRRMAGEFRRDDVKVGDIVEGQEVIHHQPPTSVSINAEVQDLLDWVEQSKGKGQPGEPDAPWIHPAIVAGVTHHRLVWIHPFMDGNGRTARMFTTLILYQRKYDFKYLFNLSEYYNKDRDRYYEALRTADRTDDYTEWLEYFLGGLSHQMVTVEAKARKAAVGVEKGSG